MIRKLQPLALALVIVATLPALAMAKSQLPVFTDLAEHAGKAVVNISTESKNQAVQPQQFFGQDQLPEGHPFREFFERFFGGQMPNQPRKQNSLGSGFIISEDGYVVTNNHVVQDADKVSVLLQDEEKEYEAKVVGLDPETDLALLKIEAGQKLPVLRFGNSETARVGEWVLAIGNPFGLGHTVTQGIISAKGRILGAGPFDDFIQTDASINPGNSGGPLIDLDGRVIGINTAIIPSGEGLGFAIPSNMAAKIIQQLKSGKTIKRGWLGVSIRGLSDTDAKALGLDKPTGALVAQVFPEDPAGKAGVKQGDVILSVNGKTVDDNNDLLRKIAGLRPGDKAHLVLWRNGEKVKATVTLGDRSKNARQQQPGKKPAPQKDQSAQELGITLRPVADENEAKALGLEKPEGLVITGVKANSPAMREGLRQGDVIVQANQQDVNSVEQLRKVLDAAGERGAIMLLVKRQGRSVFIAIPIDKK
ncbi:DegQ family serine endoprotease [Salidesulfovibrio brasiliensis]